MAAELVTPMDELTGVPYPIMPRTDLPPTPNGRVRNIERVADWHHPFHPRSALISEGMGAMAIRNCRIQWAEYDDHHHKYHGAYLGPELPESPEDQFHTTVFATAGYVPPYAITFNSSRKPVVRPLDEGLRDKLWSSGQLRVGNPATVRDFLIAYTLQKDFKGVNDSTIDEFLHTTDMRRKHELGGTLLAIAAYDAAAPLQDTYKESRKQHLIPAEQARTAGRFIFGTMTAFKRARALGALTNKLAA
jgi:hypothetical protein